jgi:hypothetical protein
MHVRTLVDAGRLIRGLIASDQWPEWSVFVLSQSRGLLHTSEIVLDEAC